MSEPIHIISLGAGVQSSTMALMAAHGEITPMPKCAVFADTQDEPKSVYVWLDWLDKQLPFPVHRVTKGSLSEASLKLRHIQTDGHNFPKGTPYLSKLIPVFGKSPEGKRVAAIGRHCTADFKIAPFVAKAREIASVKRGEKQIKVIKWIGISWDEVHRMKPSQEPWSQHWYPLIDKRITRRMCLAWMKKLGYPEPPRSACVYCPFHSDAEWRRIKSVPQEWSKAVTFDKELRSRFKNEDKIMRMEVFLHDSMVPLDQVDFSTDEDHGQQVMFGNECEGMCGV